jgi:hypothetical protein
MNTPIALDNFELPPQTIAIIENEISKMGIDGTLRIGAIERKPEVVYFLWHASGDVPVSMTALRSDLESSGVQRVIESFKSKWQRRIQ